MSVDRIANASSYGSSINESSVFKVWCDSISDVERADVSVLDDVISVCDGYKQCDLSKDEILLTIEIICTNCKRFKQCWLFFNANKDIIIISLTQSKAGGVRCKQSTFWLWSRFD